MRLSCGTLFALLSIRALGVVFSVRPKSLDKRNTCMVILGKEEYRMSKQKSSSKWTLWRTTAIFVVAATVVAFAGIQPAIGQECPVEIPNEALWVGSGHADAESEAFRHWDDDNEVSTGCAKCHSGAGYLDFLGADGTPAGVVDNPAPIDSLIDCAACHNDATAALSSVLFPSGIEITGLGAEARCMLCHQGRESGVSVDEAIAEANLASDDTPSTESPALGFKNVHYLAAGAVQLGSEAHGGYEYEGKSYDIKFAHVKGLDTCTACHDPHSLEVKVEVCTACHTDVATHEDLHDIRMNGSASDYDGDGDVAESISDEIAGLQEILYPAMQAYANAAGVPIVYDSHTYPYFVKDNNGNGQADEDELNRNNRYAPWTARLLKAAYNYQFSIKDPGAYAHNGKYVIQLLHDSIEDLDPALAEGLERDDAGHFAGSEEPFRHWDEDPAVSGRCSKCHSADGLPFFRAEGVSASQPQANGLLCTTCHDAVPGYTRYDMPEVEFPSGAELDTGNPDSNLCLNCHQGRESGVSVEEAVEGLELDTVAGSLRFINVHYYVAGATRFGTEAKGAYQYKGQPYHGRFPHISSRDTCTECHNAHSLAVNTAACNGCHWTEHVEDIRLGNDNNDYDGDGDTQEGLAGEIETLHHTLYETMQDYAANVVGTGILYASNYPYFFKDTNGNGQADEGETSSSNRYNTFTPRLLKAAYNYQFVKKDPGNFAHNAKYILEVLYDGVADLATQVTVDMSNMVRPTGGIAPEPEEPDDCEACSGDMNGDGWISPGDISALVSELLPYASSYYWVQCP